MENNITPVDKKHIKDDEIDLYEILEIILKSKFLIAAVTVVGAILSFGAALYYSRNMKTETYAQNFDVNYSIFTGENLQRTANFRTVEILSLLNNDDVINEFFELQELNDEYQNNQENITPEREIIEKRAFLRKILILRLRDGNTDERSFSNKEYYIRAQFKKNSNLQTLLIGKATEIIERKLNEEITNKLTEVVSFSENTLEIYRSALEEIGRNSEVLEDLKEIKIDNLDTLLRYVDPLSVAVISENISGYGRYVALQNDITIVEEKLKIDSIFEISSSIYFVEEKGRGKIILLAGMLFSGLLGIALAFLKEFWGNFRKIASFK